MAGEIFFEDIIVANDIRALLGESNKDHKRESRENGAPNKTWEN